MSSLRGPTDNLEMYGESPDLESVQEVADCIEGSLSERYNLGGFYVTVHVDDETGEMWPQVGVKTLDTFGAGAEEIVEDILEEETGREIEARPGITDSQGYDVYTLVDKTSHI